jgi:hypothetical protein
MDSSFQYQENIKTNPLLDEERIQIIIENYIFRDGKSLPKEVILQNEKIEMENLLQKIDFSLTKLKQESHPQGRILPTKLKIIGNFLFFSYLELTEKNSEIKITDFGFFIQEVPDSTNCLLLNSKNHPDIQSTNSNEKINLTSFFQLLIGPKDLDYKLCNINYKNFETYKNFSNFYVKNFQNSFFMLLVVSNFICIVKLTYEKGKEKEFVILFRKQFSDDSLVLLVGSDLNSELRSRFYFLIKPNYKIIVLNQKYKKKSNKIKITCEEKLFDSLFLKNKISINNMIATVLPEIMFFERNSKNIMFVNKNNLNKISIMKNKEEMFDYMYLNIKSFLVFYDNSHVKTPYILTDEYLNESLLIKLWKVNNSDTFAQDLFEGVGYELVQSLTIKGTHKGYLGLYKLSFYNESYFSISLTDLDKILVCNIKEDENDILSISRILELNFHEFYAIEYDYLFFNNGLKIFLYQEEEFLIYEIPFKDFQYCQNEENEIMNKKSNLECEDSNSPKNLQKSNKIASKDPNSIEKVKADINKKLLSDIELKLEKLIDSKLSLFSNSLNDKLSNVFTFMKKQTDELEQIRAKNNEAMTNLTNLILKSSEKNKTNNQSQKNNSNTKNFPSNNNKFNRNIFFPSQMNHSIYPNLNTPINPYLNMASIPYYKNFPSNFNDIKKTNQKNIINGNALNSLSLELSDNPNNVWPRKMEQNLSKTNNVNLNNFNNLVNHGNLNNIYGNVFPGFPNYIQGSNFPSFNNNSFNSNLFQLNNDQNHSLDNKFKEDELNEKKDMEIKNEGKEKTSLSHEMKNENKQNVNYSSDGIMLLKIISFKWKLG